jgi:hypothetical protein
MQKNIMMINSDINQVGIFKQYVSSCKYNLNLSKICLDYDNNAVYSVIKEDYEFLVINYDLNKDFTISVLEYLRDNNVSKKVIIITDSDDINILNSIYKICSYIASNYTIKILNNMFASFSGMFADMKDDSIIIHTSKVLHELGIPSSIKGYIFIREAITMIYENKNMVISVTKDIYPSIAKNHNTLAPRVARAIRHAIEVAWDRGDIDAITKYFGNSIDVDKARPTNSEFMYTIADYLIITS